VTNHELLKMIVRMYHFEMPVSSELRREILRQRRKTLVAIFRRYHRFGVVVSLTVFLFFLIRRMGIRFTVGKAFLGALAAVALTVATILSVVAGIVLALIPAPSDTIGAVQGVQKEEVSTVQSINAASPPRARENAPIQYRLEVKPLSGMGENRVLAQRITETMLRKLNKPLSGKVFSADAASHEAPFVLTGSVVTLGGKTVATVRIIDADTLGIRAVFSEPVADADDAERVAAVLAEKIPELVR
jgi:TolB-like protein